MSSLVAIARIQSALLPCPAITIITYTNLYLPLAFPLLVDQRLPLFVVFLAPRLRLTLTLTSASSAFRIRPPAAWTRLDSPVSSHSRPKRLSRRRRCCCCSTTTTDGRRQTTTTDSAKSHTDTHTHKVRRPSKQLPKDTTPRTLGSCSIHTAGATLSAYPTERRAYRIHLTALPLDPRSSLPVAYDRSNCNEALARPLH